MSLAVVIAALSLGLVGLGSYCMKLRAKVARLEKVNEDLQTQNKIVKKQNTIASRPNLDPASIVDKLRNGGL